MVDIEVTPRPRTARDWFNEAKRGYSEKHQACPCCRSRHCVFRARWGSRTEYHCTACDFSAACDEEQGTFSATLGIPPVAVPAVLLGLHETPI
jgi:hypothetical protein